MGVNDWQTHQVDPLDRPAYGQGHGGIVWPTANGQVGQLLYRIEQLERALRDVDRPLPVLETLPYSMPGTVGIATSGPNKTRFSQQLAEVECMLGTAGSTSTVVTAYKNGVSIGTVTLAASATEASAHFAVPWIPRIDILTFAVTTAGTGAMDLTANGHFL